MTLVDRIKREWLIISLMIGGIIFGFMRGILFGDVRFTILVGIFVLIVINDLFKERTLAKWIGTGLKIALAAGIMWPGFTLGRAAMAVVSLLLILEYIKTDDDEESDDDDAPIRSLVLLLREPRFLDSAMLCQVASSAWGTEVTSGSGDDGDGDAPVADSPPMIIGDDAPFMCMNWPAFLIIHNMDRPYFEDLDEVISHMNEARLKKCLANHTAWVSCDLLKWMDEDDGEAGLLEGDRLAGQFLAGLVDDNCLAVLDLLNERIYPHDPEMEDKLCSDNPREALQQWYYEPIATVSGDDEEMAQAVEQARNRWPEFVEAFENRTPDADQNFAIKAEFRDGDVSEFIWVGVTAIEGDAIYGTLGNEPVNVTNVKLDDRVRVPLEDLNDWLIQQDDDMQGGFTIPVLMKRTRGG